MKEKEEDEENKIRKFAHREQTENRQRILNSKTEATLILCGWSGERANNRLEHEHCLVTYLTQASRSYLGSSM